MAGRNIKTNFDFFRMSTSFFSNKKIKALRRQFGSTGILTWQYILCYAYGNDGYYIKISSLEEFAYDIAESIAKEDFKRVSSVVTECITYLADNSIISKDLLAKGCITGENIQRQYIEMCKATKRKVEILPEYRLVDTLEYPMEKIQINSEEIPIYSEEISNNSEEIQQRKVKESKVNTTYVVAGLSDKDYSYLCDKLGKDCTDYYIERVKAFREKKPQSTFSVKATILKWQREDAKKVKGSTVNSIAVSDNSSDELNTVFEKLNEEL